MAYRLTPGKPLDSEFRKIAIEQIDKAANSLNEPGDDPHEAIHDARKRFKKLRGLIRLMRPADERFYKAQNAAIRDAAKGLSGVRDKAALVEAIEKLEAATAADLATDAFGPVRSRLVALRDQAIEDEKGHERETIEPVLASLQRMKAAFEGFTLSGGKHRPKRDAAILAEGFEQTYARARKALRKAEATRSADDFHELRKHVKYHWMHQRLLAPLWEEGFEPGIALAKTIGDDLGDDHDCAVFRAQLTEDPGSYGEPQALSVVLALMDRRQAELRQSSLDGAHRLFADKSGAVADRIETLGRHAANIARRDAGMPIEEPKATLHKA